MPQFGELLSGPGAGDVTIEIKTIASGVNNPSQGFRFIITPLLDYDILERVEFAFPDYQSGMFESVTVVGLKEGESYSFSAIAMNIYGTSGVTNSVSVSTSKYVTYSLSLSVSLFVSFSPSCFIFLQ